MMVVHESFVTRKPLEFTLVVMVILLILLIPVYIYTKNNPDAEPDAELIAETYDEVKYLFSRESDLTESDKRTLFKIKYEDNLVQWTGPIIACDRLNSMYRVSVDGSGDGFGDILFTTFDDCTQIQEGKDITFKMRLIDRKTTTFIGKDGVIIGWT